MQLFSVNQECPVGTSYQLVSIKSLPFVHTARRYYRLNVSVRCLDGWRRVLTGSPQLEDHQADAFRGSKSRNKVSVGEPAEGSLVKLRLGEWMSQGLAGLVKGVLS